MSAPYLRDQIDDQISAQIRAQIDDQLGAGELVLNPQLLDKATEQMAL